MNIKLDWGDVVKVRVYDDASCKGCGRISPKHRDKKKQDHITCVIDDCYQQLSGNKDSSYLFFANSTLLHLRVFCAKIKQHAVILYRQC